MAVLLLMLAARAFQPGLAADVTRLWLGGYYAHSRGSGDFRHIAHELWRSTPHVFLTNENTCGQYVEWLPTGNASGKLRFPTGQCLMANVNVAAPSDPSDYLALTGCCDSSLDAVQSFVLTEAGHVRLAAPPNLELRLFEDVVLFGEAGDVVAHDKCMVGWWAGSNYGDSAVEVRSFQALYALVCGLFLVYAPLFLCNASGWCALFIQWACQSLSAARRMLRERASSDGNDPIRQLVEDFRAARLQRSSKVFTSLGTFGLASLLLRFFPYVLNSPESREDCDPNASWWWTHGRVIYETELVPFIVLCIGALAGYFSRRQHITMVADFLNICLSIVWVFHYFTTSNTLQPSEIPYLYSSSWVQAARTGQALFLGNAKLTTVLNLLVSSAEHLIIRGQYWYGFNMLNRNLLVCVMIVGFGWVAELAARHEAAAKIEVQSSQQTKALLSNLLFGLCDAVVSLDESLNITQRAPKLGAMLLKSSTFGDPANCNGPSNFMTLVHPEDQGPLSNYIEACSRMGDDAMTPSIHIRLFDSLGSVAPVMIVGSTVDRAAGKGTVCHMLGITMLAEEPLPGQFEDAPQLNLVVGLSSASLSRQTSSLSISSSASLSRLSDSSSHEITLSFRAVGGIVVSAACSDPKAITGPYSAFVKLGVTLQGHMWDQQAWCSWFNSIMCQVTEGTVSLPYESHVGPNLFRYGKKKRVMMDATYHFPEIAGATVLGDEELKDYTVVLRIVRSETTEPSHTQQRQHAQSSSQVLAL